MNRCSTGSQIRAALFAGVMVFTASLVWADEPDGQTRTAASSLQKTAKLVRFDQQALGAAELHSVKDYPFMRVVGLPRPRAGGIAVYSSSDQKFAAELGRYELAELVLSDWPADEFMYFLEGSVEITDADGHTERFSAGDALVMPKGFTGHWKQLTPIRKISIAYIPAPLPAPMK